MTKGFTLGVLSGVSALALGIPALAQVSSAQSSISSSNTVKERFFEKKIDLTDEGLQAMIDRDATVLEHIDEMTALIKTATQTHKTALEAALSITDEDARAAAVKAAHETMRTTMQEAIEANPDLKAGMMFGHGRPGHKGMRMHMPGNFAEKFDMTPEELKAALEGGKTIEELAEEKGVELPVRIEKFKMKMNGGEPRQ